MKTPKKTRLTVDQLILEIKKDIRAEQKSVKDYVKQGYLEDAVDSKRAICAFEYVLELIDGEIS
jgi:hypothetical protein